MHSISHSNVQMIENSHVMSKSHVLVALTTKFLTALKYKVKAILIFSMVYALPIGIIVAIVNTLNINITIRLR